MFEEFRKLYRESKWVSFKAVVIFLLTYLRIFFGIDITDEPYYVACAYMSSVGGVPFVNDMYFQQNASLIYEPLIYIYHALFGSTGVILFVRHLYILLALATTVSFFTALARQVDRKVAMLASLIPLTFIYCSLPSLSYNTLGSLCLALGSGLTLNFYFSRRRWQAVMAAIIFSFSLFAYPAFAAGISCLLFGILGFVGWKKRRFDLGIFAIGFFSLLLLATYWGSNIYRASIEDLKVSYQVTLAYGALGSAEEKFFTALGIFLQFWPTYLLPAGVLILCLAGMIFRKFPFIIALLVFTIGYAVGTNYYSTSPSMIYLSTVMLLSIPAFLALIYRREVSWKMPTTIFVIFMIQGFVICWSSSQTAYAMTLGTSVAIVGVLALVGQSGPRWLTLPAIVVIHGCLIFWNYGYSYREASLPELTVMMDEGPWAGLWTTPKRRDLLKEISADVKYVTSSAPAASILFYDSFPAGYFLSDLRPATPSIFIHPLPYGHVIREMYVNYYRDVRKRPDVFLQLESFPFDSPDNDNFRNEYTRPGIDNFFDMLPQSGEYVNVVSRPRYKIWLKKTFVRQPQ